MGYLGNRLMWEKWDARPLAQAQDLGYGEGDKLPDFVYYSESVCYYKDLCIMSYLETVDICGRKTDSTPAIICSKFLQSIWQTSLLKQTALYLILFLYLSSVLQHPLIFFTLFCFLFFSENDETGVMDSLLEALQSGAAFRDRRKRAPRPRGESHILTSIYTETKTHT